MTRFLGRRAEAWNVLAQDADSRRGVERTIYRLLYRNWLPDLTGTQLKVFVFVMSRTLDWQKYAEAIPMSHFLGGLLDADGQEYRLDDGSFAARGTGISKEDTVRSAIAQLKMLDLITVFPGKKGSVTPANVYMPLSESRLAGFALNAGLGVLPDHLDHCWVDEHVWSGKKACRVVGYAGNELCLRAVQADCRDEQRSVFLSPQRFVRRMTLDEWQSVRKDRRRSERGA